MGKQNSQRLKVKIGFEKDDKNVDDYVELIDRIYYQNQGHTEMFNESTETTTWFFEDGRRISLDIPGVTHVALLLMSLANDADEQMLPLENLERSYFLEENRWKKLK